MPADKHGERHARPRGSAPLARPIGRPRKIVKPAMAPSRAVSAKDIRAP